jgi:DNA ligase (NAD+)
MAGGGTERRSGLGPLHADDADLASDDLSPEAAASERDRLADALRAANDAYHRDDAPELSDADYDALKRRLTAIEAAFPNLAQADSPTQSVGAAPLETFAKVRHAVRMLSLENAFSDADVTDFDDRVPVPVAAL